MKQLFLLVFAPFCLAHCPANHFKDDVFNKCLKCTPCHITLTPCAAKKDAVCEYFNDNKNNHHFLKNRIHFLDDMVDDSLDEEFHEGDFLPHKKDHHKKNGKHLKSKHEDKHHHKKKHYEFDDDNDDESSDNYNDDFDFKFEKIEKPKKHKKHFEFKKQKGNVKHYNQKMDDLLSDEDLEDEEDFIFGKDFKKNKKQASHPKKIDVNEEELEELLLQSQKKLKIQKDKFLKTLKDEKETFDKHNNFKSSKTKKNSQSDALKALADLNSNDDIDDDDDDYEDDLDSLLDKSEETYKPGTPQVKINEKLSTQVIGQGEAVNEMIKSEMGKNVIYEKPHFKIIPYAIGKDFDTQGKKSYSQKYHSPSQKKHTTFSEDNDSEEYREIESNEVVSLPFTAAETLVWDWQAVAVASAVASCLVFFLVVAIYFIVNTRHWKKANKHYNKELISELDDISTRIALMQPMLELGSPNSRTSLYMENIVSPIKEAENKGDMKV